MVHTYAGMVGILTLFVCLTGMIGGNIMHAFGEGYGSAMMVASAVYALLGFVAVSCVHKKYAGNQEELNYRTTIVAGFVVSLLAVTLAIVQTVYYNHCDKWIVMSATILVAVIVMYSGHTTDKLIRTLPTIQTRAERDITTRHEETGSSKRRRPARLRRKRRAKRKGSTR